MTGPEPASGSAAIDDIAAEIRSHGAACSAGPFIDTLPDDRRAAIAHHLAIKTDLAAIGRACRTWGYTGAAGSVIRHLGGRCKCPR